MTAVAFDDIDILDVGNSIQLAGAIWSGNGRVYMIPLPDEDLDGEMVTLRMSPSEFERFLNQSDVLDVRGPGKAILRKSQRQVDQLIAWRVFERDFYRCRYCGLKAPLTVDHVILWEDGGATVEENLVAACRRCNKTRGNMPYDRWVESAQYQKRAGSLSARALALNEDLVGQLGQLKQIVAKPRSR